MNTVLKITSFADRRTVELHRRHDEIERRRFAQRVERSIEAKRAKATVTEITVPYLRRQAG